MERCNSCYYQEHLEYLGKPICQHIQSMKGLEAVEEYVFTDEVTSCVYFYPSEE